MKNKLQIKWTLWLQGLLFVAASILIFISIFNVHHILATIGRFLSVVSPIIVAAAIAYMLSRPCKWVEKWLLKQKSYFVQKHARGLSVAVVYISCMWLIYVILSFLFPLLIENILDFIDFMPIIINELQDFILNIEWPALAENFNINEEIRAYFNDFDIQTILGPVTQSLGVVTNLAISTAVWLFDVTLALIISIYMLLYKEVLFMTASRLINLVAKRKTVSIMKYYIKQADKLFYKFIGAQFLDSCIMGAMSIILLWLLNVRFAVFLGIFLGLANMIPKFGSIVASIVVIGLTFITGDFNQGVWTAILLTAVQQFDGNVIGPMIMGDALKINPILVFFALLVGGAYFGVLGMFLSIPVMAMIKIIFVNIVEAQEGKINLEQVLESEIKNG